MRYLTVPRDRLGAGRPPGRARRRPGRPVLGPLRPGAGIRPPRTGSGRRAVHRARAVVRAEHAAEPDSCSPSSCPPREAAASCGAPATAGSGPGCSTSPECSSSTCLDALPDARPSGRDGSLRSPLDLAGTIARCPRRVDLDLARTSVFLDFDGTISTDDVGVHLLERFALRPVASPRAAVRRGLIGSRECLLDEWDLLVATSTTAGRCAPRRARSLSTPGSRPLVEELRAAGAEVTVVSDGFGFYVDDACRRRASSVPILTNAVDWATGRLEFPHEDRCCPCTSCGVCKQAPIKDARRRGRATVLVGDGTSDRKAALLADVVFAKGAARTLVRRRRCRAIRRRSTGWPASHASLSSA